MVAERTTNLTGLHPWAWWCWAIGIGVAVSGTTNPLLLGLIATAVVAVVLLRRSAAPWAASVRVYLLLGLFVIGMRLFFRIVLGGGHGETVLLTLPSIPLPQWAAGIQLGGPVTAEAIAGSLYDALRLAVMLLCIGAANALANPRQALRSVPSALYEASVAVVIALSVAPQLIESIQRVRRARRLRGAGSKGLRTVGAIALPVLADAVERSLSLAAGMEARGFGRTRGLPARGSLALMLIGGASVTLAAFLLLSTDFWQLALTLLLTGVAVTVVGLRIAGSRLAVTRFGSLPWRATETLVAGCGVLAGVVVLGLTRVDPATLNPALAGLLDPVALSPSSDPLIWPQITVPMLLVITLVLAPLPLTRPRRLVTVPSTRNDTQVRLLRAKPPTSRWGAG